MLNKFIIEGINKEASKRSNDGKDDSSLEMIFRNYAESYKRQYEKIILKKDTKNFVTKLKEYLPCVERLCETQEKYHAEIITLFNFSFSLKDYINSLENDKSNLEKMRGDRITEKKHIVIEEKSEKYHAALDKFTLYSNQLRNKEQSIMNLNTKREDSIHKQAVLKASMFHKHFTKFRNKRDALLEQIRQKENESENDYFFSLKYSLYISSKNELASIQTLITKNSEDMKSFSDNISSKKQEISKAENMKEKMAQELNKRTGKQEEKQKHINTCFERIGLYITKTLDGKYSSTDLNEGEKQLQDRLNEVNMKKEEIENNIANNKEKCLNFQQEERKNDISIVETNIAIRSVEEKIKTYNQKHRAISCVFKHWNLEEELLFGEYAYNFLNKKLLTFETDLRNSERKLEQICEQLFCVKNDTMHLSKIAVSFLKESGIDFKTGEAYLLSQPENIRNIILQNNSAVAYSVIVTDEKSRNSLRNAVSDDLWISSVIPVYTYKDLAYWSNPEKEYSFSDNCLIAIYSKQYYHNKDDFTRKLTENSENIENEVNLLKSQIISIKEDIATVIEFDYSKEDIERFQSELSLLKERKIKLENRNSEIASFLSSLEEEDKSLQYEKIKIADDISIAKHNIETFNKTLNDIEIYHVISDCINICTEKLNKMTDNLLSMVKEFNKLKDDCARLESIDYELKNSFVKCQNILDELGDCNNAKLIDGSYDILLSKYEEIKKSQNSDIQTLKSKIENLNPSVEYFLEELRKTKIDETEYTKAAYNQKEADELDTIIKNVECRIQEENNLIIEVTSEMKKEETNVKRFSEEITELGGGIIDKSKIGMNFDIRKDRCKKEIEEIEYNINKLDINLNELDFTSKSCEKTLNKYQYPETINNISLDDNISLQYDKIEKNIYGYCSNLKNLKKELLNNIKNNFYSHYEKNKFFHNSLKSICDYVENEDIKGDRYYTLKTCINADIERYEKKITQLETDLANISKNKEQLVDICLNHGREIYKQLIWLVKKSYIKINNKALTMLKIGLPNIEDEAISKRNISSNIEDSVEEYIKLPDSESENRKRKIFQKCVDLRKLLNCYIDKENIPIKVYKIDSNPNNCGYRDWEEAITANANSGGEKFVVFFSLIISMMHYSRGMLSMNKDKSGVIIMDNPFGPISSEHLLTPMFDIANHFKIQLICLSHLDTSDITKCFRNVCQVKIKQLPLSNREIVEIPPNEQLEHGFYRYDQLEILQ